MGWSSFDRRHCMIIRQRPIDLTYPRSSRSDWADGPSYPRWTLGEKAETQPTWELDFISSSQLTPHTYLWTNQLKPVYLTTSFLCVKQHISHLFQISFCIVKSSLAFDASHKMYREHNIFQIRFIGHYISGLHTPQVVKSILLYHLFYHVHLQTLATIYLSDGFTKAFILELIIILHLVIHSPVSCGINKPAWILNWGKTKM
jgi:hypothetical protein